MSTLQIIENTKSQVHSLYYMHKLTLKRGLTSHDAINFFDLVVGEYESDFQVIFWKTPPILWYKLNTDGACKGNPNLAGHRRRFPASSGFVGGVFALGESRSQETRQNAMRET